MFLVGLTDSLLLSSVSSYLALFATALLTIDSSSSLSCLVVLLRIFKEPLSHKDHTGPGRINYLSGVVSIVSSICFLDLCDVSYMSKMHAGV